MTLQKVAEFRGTMPLKWSPDSRYLATGDGPWRGQSPSIHLWDSASGANWTLVDRPGAKDWLSWSPNGHHLTTTVDTTTRIWDAASRTIVRTITHPPGEPLSLVSWSPDGRHLLIGTGPSIQVWDTSEPALRRHQLLLALHLINDQRRQPGKHQAYKLFHTSETQSTSLASDRPIWIDESCRQSPPNLRQGRKSDRPPSRGCCHAGRREPAIGSNVVGRA